MVKQDASNPQPRESLRLFGTVAVCAATTLLATPLHGVLDPANIVMLFLLTVLLVAVRWGRRAAILASVLSVLLFDVFFVPPRFSLAVSDLQYLVTFAVMLATALTTSHFASALAQRAAEAEQRERQTLALYRLARQLAGALTRLQAAELVQGFLREQLAVGASILLPDEDRRTLAPLADAATIPVEPHLALVAFDSGRAVRSDTLDGLGLAALYLPLQAPMRMRGVLAVERSNRAAEAAGAEQSLLEALASLLAVALERLHYVEVARESELRMLDERLRSSILSALSHDLRTPLTALVGLADSLFLIKPPLPAAALETAQALHERAAGMAGLVDNLLDMARLNAGQVSLRKEWQPLEEVVGASLKLSAPVLAGLRVSTNLAPDLPWLEFDAVLLERVLCNLLENSAKYAPPGSVLSLAAQRVAEWVEVAVEDAGPGFQVGDPAELFAMFVRGERESGLSGTGLGLAICKAIVEAHGGTIVAGNRAQGGARVSFRLPVGEPPAWSDEEGA